MAVTAEQQDAIIRLALPALEQQFTSGPSDFTIPLGDNWLATWNWAFEVERKLGMDHQAALRIARDTYFRSDG